MYRKKPLTSSEAADFFCSPPIIQIIGLTDNFLETKFTKTS
jgi:hypothetical protein